jgi:hypothetical protein
MMSTAPRPTEDTADPGSDRDADHAPYVPFQEFRDGLPRGRFRVIVNPELARQFVLHRVHATQLAIAIIGPGIALALVGRPVIGAVLVAVGIGFKRIVRWQAPRILLHLASRQPSTYDAATEHAVMEVRRV